MRYRLVLMVDTTDEADDDDMAAAVSWLVDELKLEQPGWWADVDELENLGT